jgi:hypothetical protein
MSAEAADRLEATQKRNTPAPYWAFFTKEAGAFWHFGDRSREDVETPHAPPQHGLTTTSYGEAESRAW